MAITGTIQGKDVVFFIEKDGNYVPFVCAKEMSIEVDAEKISVKTVGDGVWKKYAYQSLGYSVSLSSVLKFDSGNFTGWDMLSYMVQFLTVRFRMLFIDVKTAQSMRLSGEVLIERANFTASPVDLVMGELTLPGSGALVLQDSNSFCESSITSTVFIQAGFTATVRITGHMGTPARYDYSVDGGGLLSVFPTGFIADLPLPSNLSAGSHDVQITPYCANGVAGDVYNMSVDVAPSYTVIGRIKVSGPLYVCGGSPTTLYTLGSLSIGDTLYTDDTVPTPLTGFSYIVIGEDIYNIDPATGVLGTDTGLNCSSPINSDVYRISNDLAGACTNALTRLYGVLDFVHPLFTDPAMTIPVTGFSYISLDNFVYNLDPVTGVVGSYTGSSCSSFLAHDFIVGNLPSICQEPDVLYYMSTPFGIGVIIYTNNTLTTPLTGKSLFSNAQNGLIYKMNPATGEILSLSAGTCPVGVAVNVILGNDQSTVCDGSGVVRYVATTFTTGQTLFTDIGMNTPQTGFAYVVYADATPAEIYALNTATGVIGADTGVNCIQLSKYDLTVTKFLPSIQVSVEITDETTTAVNTYTFFESGSSKVFNDIMHGGTTYRIFVSISSPRKITVTDGAGLATSSFGSLTYNRTGVVPGPAGVKVEVLFLPLGF